MMPTKQQVLALLNQGLDYEDAGLRLGIAAGQVYLIATGLPADGGDTATASEWHRRGLRSGSQTLPNPPANNPTGKATVRAWIKRRVSADGQMRAAGHQAPEHEET